MFHVMGSNHPSPKATALQAVPLPLRYNMEYLRLSGESNSRTRICSPVPLPLGHKAIFAEKGGRDPQPFPAHPVSNRRLPGQIHSLFEEGLGSDPRNAFALSVFKTGAIIHLCHPSFFKHVQIDSNNHPQFWRLLSYR